ncbi:SH3 and PX domain-containing protein 2B [Mactra antiquata]
MYEVVSNNNASVVYAAVTGFAEKKFKFWFPDYFFIVEVLWTDKRTTFIKRNYDDVLKLYNDLKSYYSEKYDCGVIKSPVFIPKLEGKKLFRKNSINLAEQREMELQTFFKQLLGGNPLISTNKIILDFFQRRPTDPIPCKSNEEHPVISDDDDDDDEDITLFDR